MIIHKNRTITVMELYIFRPLTSCSILFASAVQYLSVEQVTPSKVANELREKEIMLRDISRELQLDEICSKLGVRAGPKLL